MDIQIYTRNNYPATYSPNGLNGRFGRWLKGILGRIVDSAIGLGDALSVGAVSASGIASWLRSQVASIATESPVSVINKLGEGLVDYDDELPMTADETTILERWLSDKFTPFYANLMAKAALLNPTKIGDANLVLKSASAVKTYNQTVKGQSTAQLSINAIINRGTVTNYLMDRVITLVNEKMEGQIQQQLEFPLKSFDLMPLGFDTSLLTVTARFKAYGDRFAPTDPFTGTLNPPFDGGVTTTNPGGVKNDPANGGGLVTTDPGNSTGTTISNDDKTKGTWILGGFALAIIAGLAFRRSN